MNILVIGATSTIAQAYLRRVAQGNAFVLVGRSEERMQTVAADLRSLGAVSVRVEGAATWSRAACIDVVRGYFAEGTPLDLCLIAQGRLPSAEEEWGSLEEVWDANAVEVSRWIFPVVDQLRSSGRGTLAVITSVAGDRGRSSNALYGATKAAISTLLEGQRQRMASYPAVHILDIKPGPVDTPMTAFMKKTPLFTTPDRVAAGIDRAIRRGISGVVYVPGWWRWVMLCIRLLPGAIFYRLSF